MSRKHQTLDVVTASQVARRLDVSQSKVLRAIHSGEIVVDGRAGLVYFFLSGRVPSLARTLGSHIEVTAGEVTS